VNEIERLTRELARNEDVIYRQTVNIILLLEEIDRLTAATPRTAEANNARRVAADVRAAEARRMRADGKSVGQIAEEINRTERQVYTLLKR
jgi:DNA-binding NarL/FixJ family response regulator